ncbi:MAG: hypothetical protein N4A54_14435 [Peptostreptococcaceae bacterium]|nr:hypothetical protein [Peptostreptococcaceae bacterium]
MNFKNNEKLRAKIFFVVLFLVLIYITVGKYCYREYKIYKDKEQERLLIENVDDKYAYIFDEENIYEADDNYDKFLIDLYRDLDEFKEFILEFKIANNIIKDDDYSIFRTYEELIRDNMRNKEDKLNKEDEVYKEYFIFLNDLAYNLKIINEDLKIDKDEELYINNMLAFIELNIKKYEDYKEKTNDLYEKFEIRNYKIKDILDYLNYLKLRDFIKESKDNKAYNLLFESEKDYKIKREEDEFYKIYLKKFQGKKEVNEKSINLAKQALLKLGIGEDKLKLDKNSLIIDKYKKNNEYVINKVDKIFKSVINKLNLDIKYLKSDIEDESMRFKITDEYTKIYYDYDDNNMNIYMQKPYTKDIKELQNTLNNLSYELHKQTLDEDKTSYLYYKTKENYIDERDNVKIIVDRKSNYVKMEIDRVNLFLEETDDKEFSDKENKMIKEDLNLIKSVLNVDDLKITPIKSYEKIYYNVSLIVNQKAYKKDIFIENGEIKIR